MQTSFTWNLKHLGRGLCFALLLCVLLSQAGCATRQAQERELDREQRRQTQEAKNRLSIKPFYEAGFATCQLWGRENDRDRLQPSHDAKIRLYESPRNQDILVQYEERNFRTDEPRNRAYFLFANESLVKAGKRPVFVELKNIDDLAPISLTQEPAPDLTNQSENAYFAFSHDRHWEFELRRGVQLLGTHTLPIYHETHTRVRQRILATPSAVINDLMLTLATMGPH